MRLRVFQLFTAACLVFAAAGLGKAQTVYEVEGTVYGPDGKAIPNVTVSLQNHAGVQIDQDITNSDGRYRFAGVVAGTYYLSLKPAETRIQPTVQKIELINSGASITNFSKERFDFSLKSAGNRPAIAESVFAQAVPPDAEKLYQEALSAISKGDKNGATTTLKKALQIFPTYFVALEQLGLLYIELEEDEQAIEPLTKAIQINSRAAKSHLGLGMAYVNLDRLKQAVPELNAAIALDPRLFRAHLFLGMSFITLGKLDEAEKLLKDAYAIGGPKQASAAHLYLASIYNIRKEYQKAIDELEAYLKESPKAPNAPRIREAITKLKAKL
ncbi:MAG TPA: tetratricopeptide repeat protein [Pyrinomonadaceae bacterium]|nr:tetratricopeptide repeat protein [Pyrinomonadaceae bacterium]